MGNLFSQDNSGKDESKKNEANKTPEPEAAQPAEEDKSYARQLLDAQNKCRAKHGVPSLKLNDEMSREAQKWADKLAEQNTLQHSNTDLGENLAMAGPKLEAQQAADMWYNEIERYDFKNPGYKSGVGHFTQVVWKSSEEFGCGIAKNSSGWFVVGRYKPAGNVNIPGYFEANVLSPK